MSSHAPADLSNPVVAMGIDLSLTALTKDLQQLRATTDVAAAEMERKIANLQSLLRGSGPQRGDG